MDYEQKYKKLTGKIRNAYLYAQTDSTKAVLEDILPELKGSDDERIRKALIQFHKSTIDIDGVKGSDIITWLEKQGGKQIMLNKACEWLKENSDKYYYLSGDENNIEMLFDRKPLIDDFKKAMEE